MPTLDRRARRSSAAAEAERDRGVRARRSPRARRRRAGGSRGGAVAGDAADVDRRASPRICRRTAARSLVIAGDGQPPAVHALAHAMNQALGNVGRTVVYTQPVEAEPVDQLESLRELVADMNAGKVDLLVIVGGNPVYTAPADSTFADALSKVAAPRAPQPVRRRDVGALPLADSGGALPRGVERRARLRRHRVDRPAAHRAALRRQVGARAARRDERPARAIRRTTSSASTGARRRERPTADVRRRRGGAGCTTASFPNTRVPAEDVAVHTRGRDPRSDRRIARPRSAATRRLEIVFPQRPVGPRRPLRQQRLAAGAAEADHQADVGQRRAREPGDRRAAQARRTRRRPGRRARADRQRRRRAALSRPHGPRRRCSRSSAIRTTASRAPRLRPHARRPRRHRRRLQRQRDPDVRRAVVRRRRRDRRRPARRIRSPARSITT